MQIVETFDGGYSRSPPAKRFDMTLDNLVKITTILPNFDDLAAAREGRSKVLGDRKPASTLIVGGLANPAWKIEIEGIAAA
jgi:enamine deaminase RidA (YjgF/YER057c/UK114 family)